MCAGAQMRNLSLSVSILIVSILIVSIERLLETPRLLLLLLVAKSVRGQLGVPIPGLAGVSKSPDWGGGGDQGHPWQPWPANGKQPRLAAPWPLRHRQACRSRQPRLWTNCPPDGPPTPTVSTYINNNNRNIVTTSLFLRIYISLRLHICRGGLSLVFAHYFFPSVQLTGHPTKVGPA